MKTKQLFDLSHTLARPLLEKSEYPWEILGEITGDAAPDELITKLFSQFCLGK